MKKKINNNHTHPQPLLTTQGVKQIYSAMFSTRIISRVGKATISFENYYFGKKKKIAIINDKPSEHLLVRKDSFAF